MSYELFNPYTTISRKFSRQFWSKALELAELYGWQPMGTQPPLQYDFDELNAEWDGTYLTNDGQIVKAEDGICLAVALEKAFEDISDANREMGWNPKLWMEDDFPEWLSPEEIEIVDDGLKDSLLDMMGVHPLEYFAGDEKYTLKQFIRFCRLGNFVVS
jgi:hypothetical protein